MIRKSLLVASIDEEMKMQESRYQSVKVQGGSMSKDQGLRLLLVFVFSLFTIHFSLTTVSYAKDILITNDTGTQGKGKFLIEVNSEFAFDKETVDGVSTKQTGVELESIFSYGIREDVDLIFAFPYIWHKVEEGRTVTQKENGISDVSAELKWRFYEKDNLSFALKPGISLPVGDEEKGLGAGKATYNVFLITTKEVKPATFHLNLAYFRNENKVEERKDIWQISLASEVEIAKNLTGIANIGMERNPDKTSNTHPAFILGGLNYSVTESFDINVGVKGGLNKPETDTTILAGIAMRF